MLVFYFQSARSPNPSYSFVSLRVKVQDQLRGIRMNQVSSIILLLPPIGNPHHVKRIVHLDLKGAPPKPEVYEHLFSLFRQLNLTAVLMEYEDMFPYSGSLSKLALPYAYSPETIREIHKAASNNSLEIIPLVQTFGHLEFALKNPEFASLREIPEKTDSVCPSDDRSVELIKEMLRQVGLFSQSLATKSHFIICRCDTCIHTRRPSTLVRTRPGGWGRTSAAWSDWRTPSTARWSG